MQFYGTFAKIDAEQRVVEGYASTDAVDAHGEIVLKSAIEDALADYLEYGNVREMHQLSAVGKAIEATIDDKGLYLVAKIVDNAAWEKVTEGVYKGFSIGGKVLARDPKSKKTITKVRLDEISVVDRPSNPEAKFDLWRAAAASDPAARALAALDHADQMLASIAAPGTTKSMYHVSRFAEVLETLAYLATAAENEAELENDESPVPADLRKWLKAGSKIFAEMAAEEVAEFVSTFGPPAKAIGKSASGDRLMKVFTDQAAEIDRLNKLLAEPLPPKTAGNHVFKAISKETDSRGRSAPEASVEQAEILLGEMSEDERAITLIKAAHRLPMPVRN